MLSTEFTAFPLASITVDRSVRQRRELTEVDELAASIREVGLMHPIIITREGTLVAGERRYEAHKLLGWDSILVRFADTLDPIELHLLELEENVKRVQLTWQDQTAAVAEYHRLKVQINPEHSVQDTALELGKSDRTIRAHIAVADEVAKGDSTLLTMDTLSAARNHVTRKTERSRAAALAEVVGEPVNEHALIQHANFLEWSKTPLSQPFNFIHCDFPYGISTGDKQSADGPGETSRAQLGKAFGSYDDSPEVYFALLDAFFERQDNFIAPQAHCLFWLSMRYWDVTRAKFEAAGWRLCPFPLIWGKSDNTGVLADPMRLPRNTAEFAIMASRGDHKIVRSVGSVFWGPTTKQYHTSEKSAAMLSHFFRMFVDEYTRVLDPTCGSGMAIKVAEQMGAPFALGLEQDLDFYQRACDNLKAGYGPGLDDQSHT